MKTVLLIDNFDSFTFNLYQYLGELADSVTVVRNTDIPFQDIEASRFSHIVISPGPGNPTDTSYFGDAMQVIRKYHKTYPILGICLGHQGIGAAFGGSIIRAPEIMHGKVSSFRHRGEGIFLGVPDQITVMRYHSLAIDPSTLPDELIVDALADDGTIMALHHKQYPVFGLQFHPESFRTDYGKQLLANFLEIAA
jgi:anthranilate synthase component II